MPTLWLPTDNPWEFRRLPFLKSIDGALIEDVGSWDKRDWIQCMTAWPRVVTLPDTPPRKELLENARVQNVGKSKWLELYELDRHELFQELLLPQWYIYKPYADFSIAVLRFCQQAHLRLEKWKSLTHSHVTLWGFCEFSTSLHVLRKSGYYGNPDVNSRGHLLGKGIQYKQNNQTIKIHQAALKKGGYTGTCVEVQFPDEHLLDYLLYDAINFVNLNCDEDLKFHCKQFLEAFRHFNWLVNNHSQYETIQIGGESVHVPTRGRHSPKGFAGGSANKRRGRGRPPKGQSKEL